jgi:hypothetical protein
VFSESFTLDAAEAESATLSLLVGLEREAGAAVLAAAGRAEVFLVTGKSIPDAPTGCISSPPGK